MNSILATYDISSIQDYIFSSGRLSQNSGLSRLIGSLLENAIRTVIPDAYGRYSNNDIVDKAHTQVLYIGGGNAQIFGLGEYSDFNRKLYVCGKIVAD